MSRVKKILNLHEEATEKRLRKACEEWNATVYAKVRLADVFPIEGSGLSDEHYRFALQAHFDFIIADQDHSPLFAVEFDGEQHRAHLQGRRDAVKNQLCERFQFPLLRINARYLPKRYRRMDLLSWFVEAWFMDRAFAEAQDKGLIPPDEPFVPGSVLAMPGRKERFPLWLSLDARAQITRLHQAGKCYHAAPSSAVGKDSEGNYRAIAYILIRENAGVMAGTAMHNQLFPISPAEALDEIVVLELFDKLKATLAGENDPASVDEIQAQCEKFCSDCKIALAGTYGQGPLIGGTAIS